MYFLLVVDKVYLKYILLDYLFNLGKNVSGIVFNQMVFFEEGVEEKTINLLCGRQYIDVYSALAGNIDIVMFH